MQPDKTDMTKYCQCMEEIKRRANIIDKILNGFSLGAEDLDGEIVCLHLRKILELIAFSSLIANKQKYSEAREQYIHDWSANKIIKKLQKINPEFYPVPMSLSEKNGKGVRMLDKINLPYLDKDDFITLLNLCNEVLHVWNPYSPKNRVVNFGISMSEWLAKIRNLLSIHTTNPVDSKDYWLITMVDPAGKAHAYFLKHADDEHLRNQLLTLPPEPA